MFQPLDLQNKSPFSQAILKENEEEGWAASIIEHKKEEDLPPVRLLQRCGPSPSAKMCWLVRAQDSTPPLGPWAKDSSRSTSIHQLLPGPPLNKSVSLVHFLPIKHPLTPAVVFSASGPIDKCVPSCVLLDILNRSPPPFVWPFSQ